MPAVVQKIAAGGTPVTVVDAVLPDGPATAGNLLLAIVGTNGNSYGSQITYDEPEYTEVGHAGTNSPVVLMDWKVATGGETTYHLSTTNSQNARVHLYEISDIDPVTPIDVYLVDAAGASGLFTRSIGPTAATAARPGLAIVAAALIPPPTNVPSWSNGFIEGQSGVLQSGLGGANQPLVSAILNHAGGGTLTTAATWTNGGGSTPKLIIVNIKGPAAGAGGLDNEIRVGLML